ncbi:RsiV family protein [Acinetobacter sp. MD2(2019)]|uniref:RsiV family protein n=1 Tax=Acinetobacter sp. MD2(2019) TaxID=2605273 RepID=UPI002D1E9BB8|nr:DUF3298 domain-containing protein [Acinetobacter sp. MD2(2019)]MEB3753635.1 DUF3298 domain-containing protein [Acinetobacter sp. MD2(2019)]
MNSNTKITTTVVMSLGLMLSACQKQQDHTASAASETTASAPAAVSKPTFSADVQPVGLSLPKCQGNACSEFKVQQLKSNVPFIDEQVNKAILDNLKEILDVSDLSASELSASQSQVNLQNQDEFTRAVAAYAADFVSLDQQLKKIGTSAQLSLNIEPKVMPSPEGLVTIQLNTDNFMGGAHGAASQQYLVFDLDQKKQLKLDDVLLKQQHAALEKLAYAQFKQWVMEQKLADNVKSYEQAWPFKLSDNFYFDDKGLNLQYGEYEIGPYVVGMPSFHLSYAQLNGIVKPQYLAKTAS